MKILAFPLFAKKATPKRVYLVQGFIPHFDDQVREIFYLLVEYTDGKREVETEFGGLYPFKQHNFSIPSRVRAWERGGTIAKDILIDLTKFDKAVRKAAA